MAHQGLSRGRFAADELPRCFSDMRPGLWRFAGDGAVFVRTAAEDRQLQVVSRAWDRIAGLRAIIRPLLG